MDWACHCSSRCNDEKSKQQQSPASQPLEPAQLNKGLSGPQLTTIPLNYLPAAQGGFCATAHISCYTWINTQQVKLETTKLFKLDKCLKGHSSFMTSATNWLGTKLSDIFSWFPPGLRATFRSGLQIVLHPSLFRSVSYTSLSKGLCFV